MCIRYVAGGWGQTHIPRQQDQELARPPSHRGDMGSRPMARKAAKRRGPLAIWFDTEMISEAKPTSKRGWQPVSRGEEDQKTVGDCCPDERHSVLPDDESVVRDGLPADRANGTPPVACRRISATWPGYSRRLAVCGYELANTVPRALNDTGAVGTRQQFEIDRANHAGTARRAATVRWNP